MLAITQRQNTIPSHIMVLIMGAYFVLSLAGILHHEIWLDEAQHFLIARDSTSIASLFSNMKYDGHVQLWNYCLFFITHYISSKVIAMQLFHLLIINAAVFIFLRFAPLSMLVKLLVITGYYFLFEYSLLSRNYAFGVLFLFITCYLSARANVKMRLIGLFCFLMCITHLFFLFAATGVFVYFLYDSIQKKRLPGAFTMFACLYIAGVLLAFLQMRQIPPDNTYFHPGGIQWSDAKNPSFSIYGLARGFFPLQNFYTGHSWNTYMLDHFGWPVKVLLSLIVLVYPFFVFRRNMKVLLFYYTVIALILCFLLLTQMFANRYYGVFFISFLAALWLAGNDADIFPAGSRWLKTLLYFILSVQVFAGVYAYIEDVRKPFSLAKDAVQYIEDKQSDMQPIVVDGYGGGPAVSAYLRKPVFYLDIDMPGSYCIWKTSFFHVPPLPLQGEVSSSVYLHTLDSFVFISTRSVKEPVVTDASSVFKFTELRSFTGGVIKPDYYLYSVQRTNK